MTIKQLASSSAGNAFLVHRSTDTILIDCGVKVTHPFDILVITHTHGDHVGKDFKWFYKHASKHIWTAGYKVYKEVKKRATSQIMRNFRRPITLGMRLKEVKHDKPCYAVMVRDGEERYGHVTDTDYVEMPSWFKNCDYYSIESNYDPILLKQSGRPLFLIERIANTHMSNEEAVRMYNELKGDRTKWVKFMHISSGTNSEIELEMAQND